MPNYKCVFTFTQFNQQWSEIWYQTASSLQAVVTLLTPAVVAPFLYPRDQTVTLIKIRVSDTANNRTSTVLQQNVAGALMSTGPDVTSVCALMTIASPTYGVSRKVWLRGLSDYLTVRNGNTGISQPGPLLGQALTNYVTALVANGWLVQSRAKVSNPPVYPLAWTQLYSITAPLNGNSATIFTGAAPLPAQYTLVSINRVSQKDYPGLTGIFQVTNTVAGGFQIAWNSTQVLTTANITGRWRAVTYQYGAVAATGSGFQIFTTRKTGKNSTGGRGARSAQRLRHAQ